MVLRKYYKSIHDKSDWRQEISFVHNVGDKNKIVSNGQYHDDVMILSVLVAFCAEIYQPPDVSHHKGATNAKLRFFFIFNKLLDK